MIVKALPPEPGRTWPATGARLAVLEIHVGLGREPEYRVEREERTPVLVPASEVEIVDSAIPATWVIEFNPAMGTLLIALTRRQDGTTTV
jgi:hypothetical protein